jgi:hypothetical protein
MAEFVEVLKGLPGMNAIGDTSLNGLISMVVSDLAGRHRWPFLLKTQQSKTWAASTATQAYPGIARIISIMFPDPTTGYYYRLEELSDIEFQKRIELYPSETQAYWWRDAGMTGNQYQIEMYAVPSSATTIKLDYVELPANDDIDTLPSRFQSLVTLGVRALANPETPFLLQNYENAITNAIAREQDLQGKRYRMGVDPIQASRANNVNNPS